MHQKRNYLELDAICRRLTYAEMAAFVFGLAMIVQQIFMHYLANQIIQLQEIIQRLLLIWP